jgi:hypothetical protein
VLLPGQKIPATLAARLAYVDGVPGPVELASPAAGRRGR